MRAVIEDHKTTICKISTTPTSLVTMLHTRCLISILSQQSWLPSKGDQSLMHLDLECMVNDFESLFIGVLRGKHSLKQSTCKRKLQDLPVEFYMCLSAPLHSQPCVWRAVFVSWMLVKFSISCFKISALRQVPTGLCEYCFLICCMLMNTP